MLYQALSDWGFDGFVTADDTGTDLAFYQYSMLTSERHVRTGRSSHGSQLSSGCDPAMVQCRWHDTILRFSFGSVSKRK